MSRHLMARFRHAAPAREGLQWEEGGNLPHVLRDIESGNKRLHPSIHSRPEESSLAMAHLGEQLHGIQITKSNSLEDIDWHPEPDPPYDWDFHKLVGDDPNDPSHWEQIVPDYWPGGGGAEARPANDMQHAEWHVNDKWPTVRDGKEYTILNRAWTPEEAKQRAEEAWSHYVERVTGRRDQALDGFRDHLDEPDGGYDIFGERP